MRKFSFLFLVLSLALPASALETWTTFQDETASFTIEVPAAPKVEHFKTKMDDGRELPTSTYTIDRGEVAMMVMVGDLLGIQKDPVQILDDTVGGVAEGKTLVSKVDDSLDGYVGRHAKVLDKDGNLYNDRVFLVDGKLYQLLTIEFSAASPEKRAEVERVLKSLHFPAKQKEQKK